jgi:hypothetical protein
MDNHETLATLGTQDRGQTTQKSKKMSNANPTNKAGVGVGM